MTTSSSMSVNARLNDCFMVDLVYEE
jgi:hypothetical protein